MNLPYSLSVIVPAKNEEENILKALASVNSFKSHFLEVEVIFIDDGSTDKTFDLAQKYLESNFKKFKIIQNKESKNLGGAFKQGLEYSRNDYIIVVQGQNAVPQESLLKIIESFDESVDIIIPYQANYMERPFFRMVFSRAFVILLCFISGVKLHYFNHSCLMKRSQLRDLKIKTSSYAYQAEILIKLIRRGASFKEIPVNDNFSHKKKTNAFKIKNIIGVGCFFIDIVRYRLRKNE